MQINLDSAAIAKTVNETATKAVSDAFGTYTMREAVAKIITDEVASTVLAEAVKKAIAGMDKEALTQTLAAELQRAVTSTVTVILTEGLVDIVCKLRAIGSYGEDIPRREAVRAEIRGQGALL